MSSPRVGAMADLTFPDSERLSTSFRSVKDAAAFAGRLLRHSGPSAAPTKKGSNVNLIKSLNILVAAASLGLSLPAIANSDFEREMARTDGDFHGTSATTAKDSS